MMEERIYENVAPEVGAVAVVVRADVKPVAFDGGWCAPSASIASDAATWSLPPAASAAHAAHASGGMAAISRLMVTKTPCRMMLRTHASVKLPWEAS